MGELVMRVKTGRYVSNMEDEWNAKRTATNLYTKDRNALFIENLEKKRKGQKIVYKRVRY